MQRSRQYPSIRTVAWSDHHRPCTVSKQHGDITTRVAEVEPGRMHLCTDEKDVPEPPGRDELLRDGQPINETGALVPDVQRRDIRNTQLGLQQTATSRKADVRAQGREDDHIQITRLEPGITK